MWSAASAGALADLDLRGRLANPWAILRAGAGTLPARVDQLRGLAAELAADAPHVRNVVSSSPSGLYRDCTGGRDDGCIDPARTASARNASPAPNPHLSATEKR